MSNGVSAKGVRVSNRVVEVTGPARSILRGELDKIGLATLLTILDMERRSGMVLLQHARLVGRLHIREGRVIRARIEGGKPQSGHSGADAVYEMVSWTEGQFEVWQTNIEGRDEIRQSVPFLLMEAARRIDEARGGAGGSAFVGERGGEDFALI